MFKTATPALLSLLLAATPLIAQTTDDTTTDDATTEVPATEASEPEAPATEAPAMDTPVDAEAPAADATTEQDADTPVQDQAAAPSGEPRPGQPYIREEFGDWALRCLRAEAGEDDPCQLYQLLMDEDDNAVAEFSTFPLPAGGEAAAGATIVVPLETLLPQGLRLTIDDGQPKTYPFTFCNPAGCVARVGFTSAEVSQLKRGAGATLRMVPAAAPDQEVLLNVSLTGFTAGFDSVNQQ